MNHTHAVARTAASRMLTVLVTSTLSCSQWSALHAQEAAPPADQATQQAGTGQEIEAMVSTGTLIPQSEVATSLPVTTFDRDTIDRTGATTVTDLLRRLPQ